MPGYRATCSLNFYRTIVKRTMDILSHVAYDPEMFRKSEKGKNKHIVVITGKTTLYYRVKPRKKEVELLLFWDNRRNPEKIHYYPI
jgi:hypothetical protein